MTREPPTRPLSRPAHRQAPPAVKPALPAIFVACAAAWVGLTGGAHGPTVAAEPPAKPAPAPSPDTKPESKPAPSPAPKPESKPPPKPAPKAPPPFRDPAISHAREGDATIRAPAGGSEIVIRTTARTAGAMDSLTWGGKEFIDTLDHGRQFQIAANFDCGRGLKPETFNPTEAGSRNDHVGPDSSSRLLHFRAAGNELVSVCRPAFWLAPGQLSGANKAYNDTVVSDHLIGKHVIVGLPDLPHAIEVRVTYTLPPGERHLAGTIEALTGYMPAGFSEHLRRDPATGKYEPFDDGKGEQPHPLIFSTPDGGHAMGVYSPDQPSPGFEQAGYGSFRFPEARVVKWNCVFRVRDKVRLPAGDYRYRIFTAVGTRADVEKTLNRLIELHPGKGVAK